MAVGIYVDGSGSPRGGFGWLVKETGESHYEKRDNVTNNQAEYMAIISAVLHARSRSGEPPYDDVVIYSDSQNTVKQLNHEHVINNEALRELARQCWSEIAGFGDSRRPDVRWISRKENPAGKMLGS